MAELFYHYLVTDGGQILDSWSTAMIESTMKNLSAHPRPSSDSRSYHTAAVSEEGPKVAKFLDR